MPGRPAASWPAAFLIASRSSFEEGYVASVLNARGVTVIGPIADARRLLDVINSIEQKAAIIVHMDEAAAQRLLATELRGRGVAVMTLEGSQPRASPTHEEPISALPFAVYQNASRMRYVGKA